MLVVPLFLIFVKEELGHGYSFPFYAQLLIVLLCLLNVYMLSLCKGEIKSGNKTNI